MKFWFRQITAVWVCDSLFECLWCCMKCPCHDCALTQYWCPTCLEKFWSINRITQNTQTASVSKSPPPKAAHCVYRKDKDFVDVCFWSAVCDVFLSRCGHNDNESATQPEDLRSETKPSVQTHQQRKLHPRSVLQYCVQKPPSEQVTGGREEICWLVSINSDRIFCRLLIYEQK